MKIQSIAALKAGTATMALGLMLVAAPAMAQDAAENAEDAETIIVTGTRIARPEIEGANPIIAVTADAIENTGQTNVANVLTRVPALTGSIGSARAGGRDADFNEFGVNLLDLRNLGVDRTLVLVNGKRHVAGLPNTAAVDINTIPQDLIEKVDVLTGGASAIYGADGVSGVVNFILKRNFEGLRATAQAGISSYGDGGQQYISVTAGKNFADDRANIALAYEFSNQNRVSSFDRPFSGELGVYTEMRRRLSGGAVGPGNPRDIPTTNLTWADSSPDGAIDLDLDGVPDFTGSGLPYDSGIFIPGSGGKAIGGTNTPVAGYYGDIEPKNRKHSINLLASFEVSPALRLFAEAKYVNTFAYSVGQPAFDFFTFLQPDNAYLNQRFGAAAAPDGALLTRDHLDLGLRGERIKRETWRGVFGAEGEISSNVKYELSYVYGKTSSTNTQTSNLIADRYYAALDAVVDPATNQVVCRSTLSYAGVIDLDNFGGPATTFTPGANSACRPLNLIGEGVASQEALDFVLANNTNRYAVDQHVVSGSLAGTLDGLFSLPGGSVGWALGAEYRRESSTSTPDLLIQNGDFRDFAQQSPSNGKFDVKEVFGEVNLPILADQPFAHLLSLSGAVRYSDYSTIGSTTTWKVSGQWSPIPDIRFRGSYSRAVRAPNIGELFAPQSGAFAFITDPCDITRLNEGTQFRAANCSALLSGLGLSAAQIAAFSPGTDPQNTTSRFGLDGGNPNLTAETAKTWTAGVVLRPSFAPGLTVTFDWYNIRLNEAVNTVTATRLANLCVDQPTINNVFCGSIFRDSAPGPSQGFILGDGGDPLERIGFVTAPQNVAFFRTSGADFTINYELKTNSAGRFSFNLAGGYLQDYSFIPIVGGLLVDDTLRQYKPRWRGNLSVDWKLENYSVSYGVNFFSKTRRFTAEQIAGTPNIAAPEFLFYKALWQHDIRAAVDFADEKYTFYVGVNNLFNQKPAFDLYSYPISGLGRFMYAGVKLKLGGAN